MPPALKALVWRVHRAEAELGIQEGDRDKRANASVCEPLLEKQSPDIHFRINCLHSFTKPRKMKEMER